MKPFIYASSAAQTFFEKVVEILFHRISQLSKPDINLLAHSQNVLCEANFTTEKINFDAFHIHQRRDDWADWKRFRLKRKEK